MAEYVSREEARKILCDVCGCMRCDIERCPFFQELDRLPVADVVPRTDYESMEQTVYKLTQALGERKKGKWIPRETDFVAQIFCSNCYSFFWQWMYEFKFCPNCGADMSGEEDG